ncbi:MAG: helix-turn-helix transcriptional regulator [Verrucomicrobiota bacterium]
MLRYVSHGPRPFGAKPFAPIRRPYWEFFAVVAGQLAPVATLAEKPTYAGTTFWLFPPGNLHGWKAPPHRTCRVAVFQYDHIPPVLERLANRPGGLELQLKPAEKRRCDALARELMPYVWVESEFKAILAERVLLDLTLLILRSVDPAAGNSPRESQDLMRVLAAEKRFRTELRVNPPLAHLAFAAGVSEAHLRRLFWQVRRRSPRAVTQEIRMQAALALLRGSDQKLESIALECGFGSTSNFCHAFKQLKQVTPAAWRRRRGAARARS